MPKTHVNRADLNVVALVTAYNEEKTVAGIVEVLKTCPSIDRIQVVNDGSTDHTRQEAEKTGVKVINLPERIPVGQAIMHHLTELKEEAILLWCDADLVGLKSEYIETLIRRFREEEPTQSMSSRGVPTQWPNWMRTRPFQWAWIQAFGHVSGERAILRSDFVDAIELSRKLNWAEMMRGYGIVLFLNWYSEAFGNGFVVSYFDQLRQRQKYEKWGKWAYLETCRQWIQFGVVYLKIRVFSNEIRATRRTMLNAKSEL